VESLPQDAERARRRLRYHPVSEDVETVAVHAGGQPIIHSTKAGFRCRSAGPDAGGRQSFPFPFQSRARGVGSDRTVASVRSPSRALDDRLRVPPLGFDAQIPFCDDPYSDAVGVGVGSQHEEAIAAVRGSDGCRWYAVPFRRPPALGQRSEYCVKWSAEDARHVFHEEEPGSHVASDTPDVIPEPSLVGDASARSGNGDRLAREARSDEIHAATPGAPVERAEVTPDRSRVQRPLLHSRQKDLHGSGFPLHVSDHSDAGGGEGDTKLQTCGPGTKSQDIQRPVPRLKQPLLFGYRLGILER
jgi:hypothetical protein